jgi:hypothetical protein
MRLLSEEYNGWSNRETWAVALHLNNDQGFIDEVEQFTHRAIQDNPLEEAGYRLADSLEEWVSAFFEFDTVSTNEHLFIMMTDIGSLYRVNWREIAQTYVDTMVSDRAIGLQGVAL